MVKVHTKYISVVVLVSILLVSIVHAASPQFWISYEDAAAIYNGRKLTNKPSSILGISGVATVSIPPADELSMAGIFGIIDDNFYLNFNYATYLLIELVEAVTNELDFWSDQENNQQFMNTLQVIQGALQNWQNSQNNYQIQYEQFKSNLLSSLGADSSVAGLAVVQQLSIPGNGWQDVTLGDINNFNGAISRMGEPPSNLQGCLSDFNAFTDALSQNLVNGEAVLNDKIFTESVIQSGDFPAFFSLHPLDPMNPTHGLVTSSPGYFAMVAGLPFDDAFKFTWASTLTALTMAVSSQIVANDAAHLFVPMTPPDAACVGAVLDWVNNPVTACGDGMVGEGEQCDIGDLQGATCVSEGFAGGNLQCSAACTYLTTSCIPLPVCGDGFVNGVEECDGSDVGDITCVEVGFGSGSLTCNNDCTLNVNSCFVAEVPLFTPVVSEPPVVGEIPEIVVQEPAYSGPVVTTVITNSDGTEVGIPDDSVVNVASNPDTLGEFTITTTPDGIVATVVVPDGIVNPTLDGGFTINQPDGGIFTVPADEKPVTVSFTYLPTPEGSIVGNIVLTDLDGSNLNIPSTLFSTPLLRETVFDQSKGPPFGPEGFVGWTEDGQPIYRLGDDPEIKEPQSWVDTEGIFGPKGQVYKGPPPGWHDGPTYRKPIGDGVAGGVAGGNGDDDGGKIGTGGRDWPTPGPGDKPKYQTISGTDTCKLVYKDGVLSQSMVYPYACGPPFVRSEKMAIYVGYEYAKKGWDTLKNEIPLVVIDFPPPTICVVSSPPDNNYPYTWDVTKYLVELEKSMGQQNQVGVLFGEFHGCYRGGKPQIIPFEIYNYNICGNEEVEAGEECDAGREIDHNAPDAQCRKNCVLPYCGDGIIDIKAGEVCDNGKENGNVPGAFCRIDCTKPICGDGVVDESADSKKVAEAGGSVSSDDLAGGEQCDDENTKDGDGCSSSCLYERCGNQIVDKLYGEECDDGNRKSYDGCSAACLSEEPANGRVDRKNEQCDDGNTRRYDGCYASRGEII